ncbi:MAG: T9SS type A sorting domain-containing protein [Chitinophagaceae bacterium]|jgi:hypothetical protein
MKNTKCRTMLTDGKAIFKKAQVFKKVILLSSAFLLAEFSAKSQNLVFNASFEQARTIAPTLPPFGSFIPIATTPSAMPNWAVPVGPYIDWHHQAHGGMGCPPAPGGGINHIDLNRNGAIQQSGIALIPSSNYTITYYSSIHSGFAGGGTANAIVEIVDAASTVLFTDNINKTSADVGIWSQTSLPFTTPPSISGICTLRAKGTGTTVYNDGGVLVDSFVIEKECSIDLTICRNLSSRNVVDLTLNSAVPGSFFEVNYGDGSGWQTSVTSHIYGSIGSYTICVREKEHNLLLCEKCMDVCINNIDVIPFSFKKTTSGLKEMTQNNLSVVISPNPTTANATLNIVCKEDGDAVVSVTDITGKLILNTNAMVRNGSNMVTLTTKNFSPGIYNVQVVLNGVKITERLSVVE